MLKQILSLFAAVLFFYAVHSLAILKLVACFYYWFGSVLGTSITCFMQEYILVDGDVMYSAFSADTGTDR
jgi:hypothetical protein